MFQTDQMTRDNFTESVRRSLKELAGGLCSNPDCRVATQALAVNGESSASIGVAAHIHAAAPGGPRYLAEMTPRQRAAATNGIWLCQSCSIRVDRDFEVYHAELLRQWRLAAAAHARQQIGRRAHSDADVIAHVTQALTGLPTSYAPSAISNVHAAASAALEAIDPRIAIATSYVNGHTEVTLQPRQPVNAAISFEATDPEGTRELIRQFQEQGESVAFGITNLSAKGSPLLEKIANEIRSTTSIALEPTARCAEMTLGLHAAEANAQALGVNLVGHLYVGSKASIFQGNAWGGLLKYKQSIPYDSSVGIDSNVSLELNFEVWERRQLRALPYLDRALAFIKAIAQGGCIDVSLDVDGKEVLRQTTQASVPRRECQTLCSYLKFVRCVSLLANWCNSNAEYMCGYFPDEDAAEGAFALAKAVEHPRFETPSTISTQITVGDGLANVHWLLGSSSNDAFRFTQDDVRLEVYGSTLNVGQLITDISGFNVSIDKRLDEIKEGDAIEVTFSPTEKFSLSRRLIRPELSRIA